MSVFNVRKCWGCGRIGCFHSTGMTICSYNCGCPLCHSRDLSQVIPEVPVRQGGCEASSMSCLAFDGSRIGY